MKNRENQNQSNANLAEDTPANKPRRQRQGQPRDKSAIIADINSYFLAEKDSANLLGANYKEKRKFTGGLLLEANRGLICCRGQRDANMIHGILSNKKIIRQSPYLHKDEREQFILNSLTGILSLVKESDLEGITAPITCIIGAIGTPSVEEETMSKLTQCVAFEGTISTTKEANMAINCLDGDVEIEEGASFSDIQTGFFIAKYNSFRGFKAVNLTGQGLNVVVLNGLTITEYEPIS